jgi:hypothetical protein
MFSTTAENMLAKLRADEERSEKFRPRWWRAVGPFQRRCLWPVVRNKKDLLVVDTNHPRSACPTQYRQGIGPKHAMQIFRQNVVCISVADEDVVDAQLAQEAALSVRLV